jgi:GGDEF domain-containing protein
MTASSADYDNQVNTTRMRSKAILEGDLQNMQMPTVLQSIGMSKGTGRLEVESNDENATVYFDDGTPIHCVLGSLEGQAALIELVGWEEGEFHFFTEPKFETVTIKKRLDMMLMEGAALDDQYRLLKQRNINENSYLLRNHPSITEQLFEQMLEKGTGADMTLQKRMYQVIDNKTRLKDILHKFNVNKQKWVPIMFNFATCNLVTFVDELPDSTEKAAPETDIDWSLARTAEAALTRPDTGLLTYPAFLFLLEKEYYRWERFGRPVAVILLELNIKGKEVEQGGVPGIPEPLPPAAIKEVAERINKLKRKTDVFTHYETYGFALLLPETESTSAKNFAGRLAEMLMTTPLSAAFGGKPVLASVGVGAVPDDCSSVGAMLAAARPPRPQ